MVSRKRVVMAWEHGISSFYDSDTTECPLNTTGGVNTLQIIYVLSRPPSGAESEEILASIAAGTSRAQNE